MHFPKYFLAIVAVVATCQMVRISPVHADTAADNTSAAEQATSPSEREAFARDFAQKVLAILQDPKKSFAGRKDILRQAFSNSVDIDWIARFVIGKSWNNATPEQQKRYTTLYRKYLTDTYVASFAENPDKRIRDIKIFGVNNAENESDFTVRTEMRLADAQDLRVDYLVREEDTHYKVIDIAIEHVSLIITHREEFDALAASKGIDGVIAALEKKLDKNEVTITLSMN